MKLISSGLNRYYRTMQRKYPEILWHGDESRREIALTFDDGPHPRDTPRLLEMLACHEIRASFFLIGEAVEQHPDLVEQLCRYGHQTCMHGYRHTPFPLESPITLRRQLEHTAETIAQITGRPPEAIRNLRPPYGVFNGPTLSRLIDWGYRLVMWNNIPPHWMQPLAWSIQQTLDQVQPGSVIVLHDGHGHGANVAKIVDVIVPRLKDQGYQFITIENMQRKRIS